MGVAVAVGVGANGVGGIGVAVCVAVNAGVLPANAGGLGGMVTVGVGVGAGSPPQAIDTNRTTDKTSSEMWSFTTSSLVWLLMSKCEFRRPCQQRYRVDVEFVMRRPAD